MTSCCDPEFRGIVLLFLPRAPPPFSPSVPTSTTTAETSTTTAIATTTPSPPRQQCASASVSVSACVSVHLPVCPSVSDTSVSICLQCKQAKCCHTISQTPRHRELDGKAGILLIRMTSGIACDHACRVQRKKVSNPNTGTRTPDPSAYEPHSPQTLNTMSRRASPVGMLQ